MVFTILKEDEFIEDLLGYLVGNLNGSDPKYSRFYANQNPEKTFLIGSLSDKESAYDLDDSVFGFTQSRSAVKHNSIGISFLVSKGYDSEIEIFPSCSVFINDFPTFEEQNLYIKWLKNNPSLVELQNNPGFAEIYVRKDQKLTTILTKLKDNTYNGRISEEKSFSKSQDFSNSFILNEVNYNREVNSLKKKQGEEWNYSISIKRWEFDSNTDQIFIWFVNETEPKKGQVCFLFNCHLKINLQSTRIKPFEFSFLSNNIKKIENELIRGINVHIEYDINSNIIKTLHYGRFNQPRFQPRLAFNSKEAKFQDLSTNSIPILQDLLNVMKDLFSKYKSNPAYQNKNSEYRQRADDFGNILERYEQGITFLTNNSMALKAFKLMQDTFNNANKNKYSNWRLFQIIFIVSLIPNLSSNTGNDTAEILHVNTGGGKSETYFGLLIFQLFWDRINNKNIGVSGFVKFPLRMLSIQQLQRIAQIVVWANFIKDKNQIKGEPFSLGYYVGVSEEFPRFAYNDIQKIKKLSKLPGILLSECPFCQGNVNRVIEDEFTRILHQCEKCGKIFYLYYTNEEVYRFLPSIIVSTVDKLASIATNRRFRVLLGSRIVKCPNNHGYLPYNEKCEVKHQQNASCGKTSNLNPITPDPPRLMIQDELHLLSEGFGTIDSHFESLINTYIKRTSNKELKYIAMSATLTGVEDQIYQLYGKKTIIFPGKAPEPGSNEDLFFEYVFDNSLQKFQRIIIGLKPNLRDNQYASLLTLNHIANFMMEVKNNAPKYQKKYNLSKIEFDKLLKYYQSILTYHGKVADVHGMAYYVDPVVNSKLENIKIKNRTLTGGNTLQEIKDAIIQIENFNGDDIDASFATSIVSHGVDIERWNIMIFQGMTNNTAEYIQALSRIGRKYLGIVFLWYYPNRIRDTSFFQNFSIFHKILEDKVERSAIARFAKLAYKQTVTSIFCGAILNYFAEISGKPLYTVKEVNNHFSNPLERKKLIGFIEEAYATDLDLPGANWIKNEIAKDVELRLNELLKYSGNNIYYFPNALKDNDNFYFKTQYGMRGIQPQIELRLSGDNNDLEKHYKKRN